ncbi:MAG: protein-L-isoaspartate(D-aspartate) O-methyltransferase [Rhodospirillaceae bacterium]|jgi:protein-L-isoaspartate(D-aspartate) O-methyltransferase|nr:protein-L-isoaspartate(D-aspartate) O-methyltransferase [Rhodospirillaceae bacterium]MBT4045594.1 protein-L-isoaspartate(D-aspartate) O-methyltransferase [Rhodospirillaceae bacterium]MBT4689144.1 protein-L-isoaspartate(D-aspartate) O-methyltransferase [Rhodospirillaceae bacterium]MBT5080858.1 protein-L-isoaspartate(D-aspartate) O-methyltransferase [Rhodospirillaceae bacterium]MBT5525279.1 protein-L-isoaspartate(D-aspartate) O-methyltransferase [Rhodospirillaceae bacterium]
MSYEAHKIRLIMELRKQGITDKRVLGAVERVPRELFVADAMRSEAYENIPLPISQGQTISQPFIVAYMTQALALGERDRVLEIGTGSGYQSAVLAHLCRRVCTIERYRTLLAQAETRFETLKLHNITTRLGDGGKGWPELAPFARIIVTAAAPTMPSALADQLDEDGGIMVVPVGQPGAQTLIRVRRDDAGFHEERLLDVRFVPLVDGMPQGR